MADLSNGGMLIVETMSCPNTRAKELINGTFSVGKAPEWGFISLIILSASSMGSTGFSLV
jgi:hypothetical protein